MNYITMFIGVIAGAFISNGIRESSPRCISIGITILLLVSIYILAKG